MQIPMQVPLAGTVQKLENRPCLAGALGHIDNHGRFATVSAALKNLDEGKSIGERRRVWRDHHASQDRKSTRLNSSHVRISYAVFCLKKKKKKKKNIERQTK